MHSSGVDWIRLIVEATAEEVAVEVLDHIDWEATERLLLIDEVNARRLLDYFRREAEAELAGMDLDAEARRRVGLSDWMLGEEALEGAERYAAAAAFHALAHDQLPAADDARTLVDRLMLRFKLGYALSMHDELDVVTNRHCADFAVQTIRLLEPTWGELPKAAYNFLYFRLHYWLGLQWKSLAEYRQAEDALGKATVYADTAEDRVSCTLHIAAVKEKLDDPQGAFELLQLCEAEIPEVEEDTRQLWEMSISKLRMDLGGEIRPDVLASVPQFQELAQTLDQVLAGGVPDPEAIRPMIEFFRQALEDPESEEAELRHGLLLQLALALYALGDGISQEADQLLAEAEVLEDHFADERPGIERRVLRARVLARRGEIEDALALFAEALPRAERLLAPAERLEILGEYLVALAASAPDLPTISRLADAVAADLERVLSEQPLGSARRRTREVYQRVVEAALLALLWAVEQAGVEEDRFQQALARVWQVLMASRNVELHWAGGKPMAEDRTLSELEGAFHVSLRQALRARIVEGRPWKPRLDALVDCELGVLQDVRKPGLSEIKPPDQGSSVAFFKFRDLAESRPLLVVSHTNGRFDRQLVEEASGDLEERLEAWAGSFFGAAGDGGRRGVSHDPGAIDPRDDLAVAPGLVELLPDLRPEAGDPDPTSERPTFDHPWYLFPDGLLSSLPVEMLPDRAGADVRFGQGRAVVLCLRPVVPAAVRRPVDLARGWLGLGDVPATGEISDLPGTGLELGEIRRLLRSEGVPCGELLGVEARADRLAEELVARRPAVLHLAVHGFADDAHPEACTLILADSPERAERELLPYRRIRELPLEGVGLVVLSACSGLIGRSGRSASMEGLAWAFLGRGVTQVIASRYPVDDDATVKLMLELYQGLLTLPVADALGRARDVCLVEEGIDPREVGAWSVWC